jgi:DNA-binding MarR family transcriptional regulator
MLGPRKSLLATSKALVKAVGMTSVESDLDLATADRIGQELVRLLRVTGKMRHDNDGAVGHVLAELLERGPRRVGELAHALGTDPSTVSRQVTALVEAGSVERRADPDDGRSHLLAATPSGARQCEVGRRRRVEAIATILAGWPEESRHRLAELLGRFADDMHERDARAARRPGGEN